MENNFRYGPDIHGTQAIAVLMALAVHASQACLPMDL